MTKLKGDPRFQDFCGAAAFRSKLQFICRRKNRFS